MGEVWWLGGLRGCWPPFVRGDSLITRAVAPPAVWTCCSVGGLTVPVPHKCTPSPRMLQRCPALPWPDHSVVPCRPPAPQPLQHKALVELLLTGNLFTQGMNTANFTAILIPISCHIAPCRPPAPQPLQTQSPGGAAADWKLVHRPAAARAAAHAGAGAAGAQPVCW